VSVMICVAIVADVRLYREGLAQALGRDRRVSVIGTASTRSEALELLRDERLGIVILDVAMPESATVIGEIVGSAPDVKVVAVAVPDDEGDVIAYAEAGASGIVPCNGSMEDLIAVAESAARGEVLCSPRIAAALLRRLAVLKRERIKCGDSRLTSRELEILQLIDEGRSNKEIAQRLTIEVPTVKNHVHSILEKLNVHRRAEAAAQVRRARLGGLAILVGLISRELVLLVQSMASATV
jgi:two-component system, NarL family, nitrate/nitrite response regulator NarL